MFQLYSHIINIFLPSCLKRLGKKERRTFYLYISLNSNLTILCILDDYEEIVSVRGHHYLVLLNKLNKVLINTRKRNEWKSQRNENKTCRYTFWYISGKQGDDVRQKRLKKRFQADIRKKDVNIINNWHRQIKDFIIKRNN